MEPPYQPNVLSCITIIQNRCHYFKRKDTPDGSWPYIGGRLLVMGLGPVTYQKPDQKPEVQMYNHPEWLEVWRRTLVEITAAEAIQRCGYLP